MKTPQVPALNGMTPLGIKPNPVTPKQTIVVKNLMTGLPVEIDSNTPWCCNPASETYWTM